MRREVLVGMLLVCLVLEAIPVTTIAQPSPPIEFEGMIQDKDITISKTEGGYKIGLRNNLWWSELDVFFDGVYQGKIPEGPSWKYFQVTHKVNHVIVSAAEGSYDEGRAWHRYLSEEDWPDTFTYGHYYVIVPAKLKDKAKQWVQDVNDYGYSIMVDVLGHEPEIDKYIVNIIDIPDEAGYCGAYFGLREVDGIIGGYIELDIDLLRNLREYPKDLCGGLLYETIHGFTEPLKHDPKKPSKKRHHVIGKGEDFDIIFEVETLSRLKETLSRPDLTECVNELYKYYKNDDFPDFRIWWDVREEYGWEPIQKFIQTLEDLTQKGVYVNSDDDWCYYLSLSADKDLTSIFEKHGRNIKPSVTVNSPNGGENWEVGTQHAITWTATDNVGVTSIDIYYSTDGGSTYHIVATGETNDGSYLWTIPDTPSTTCRVKVVAHDAAGYSGEDISDSNFMISEKAGIDLQKIFHECLDAIISTLNEFVIMLKEKTISVPPEQKAIENVEEDLSALSSMVGACSEWMKMIYEISGVEPPEGTEMEFRYHILGAKFCKTVDEARTYMSSKGIKSTEMNDALELVKKLELEKEGFCIVIVDYLFTGFGEKESGRYPIVCNEKGDPFWESWQFYEKIKKEIEETYKEYE